MATQTKTAALIQQITNNARWFEDEVFKTRARKVQSTSKEGTIRIKFSRYACKSKKMLGYAMPEGVKYKFVKEDYDNRVENLVVYIPLALQQ